MNDKKIVAVLCDHGCRNGSKIKYDELKTNLKKSEVIEDFLLVNKACDSGVEFLDAYKGRKILFGGCSLLEERGIYSKIKERLGLKNGEFRSFDVKADLYDLYPDKVNLEELLVCKILSMGTLLYHAEPYEEERIKPAEGILVYGDGITALRTARALAEDDISVEVLETGEQFLSPGLFSQHFGRPDQRGLSSVVSADERRKSERNRVAGFKNVRFLPSDAFLSFETVEDGFVFTFKSGEKRKFGTVVIAPEREEEENRETGALNLTDLYRKIVCGEPLKGEVVFLLDYAADTSPEVFKDVLLAGKYIKRRFASEVRILMKNAKVSVSGAQELYDECREQGIIFFKYLEDLTLKNNYGDFEIEGTDLYTGDKFLIKEPDILVIPGRSILSPRSKNFAEALELLTISDRYPQPDSLWRLPNETNRPGVFVAYPTGDNSIASLLFSVRARLSTAGIAVNEHIPVVDEDKCVYCLTCVRVCPFKAMTTDSESRVAKVLRTVCQGCGSCAAECPAEAIQLRNLTGESLYQRIRALG